MNRIERKFLQLKKKNRKALIIYLTCGFPDMKTTEKLIYLLEECGVDMIELGIPFSDPIADGPMIQYSSQRALEKGVTLDKVFGMVSRLRRKISIPLIIMSYLNPIYQYSPKKFFNRCSKTGVDGVIIPDIIVDESRELEKLGRRAGVDFIHFIAPVTNKSRRLKTYRHVSGFSYILSVTGITGVRKEFPKELKQFLGRVRRETGKPLALGFGISRPEQIKNIKKYIDGFIIGSALIKIIRNTGKNRLFVKIKSFVIKFKNR